MSDYDRVMKQLNVLAATGGTNITWIREAIALIDAERALADDLAAFIAKPVRVGVVATGDRTQAFETKDFGIAHLPVTGGVTVRFDDEWKAERDALLARYTRTKGGSDATHQDQR